MFIETPRKIWLSSYGAISVAFLQGICTHQWTKTPMQTIERDWHPARKYARRPPEWLAEQKIPSVERAA